MYINVFKSVPGALPNPGMILTQPGNLQCKKILHLVGQSDPKNIHQAVKDALLLCTKNNYSSIAFPALGTGELQRLGLSLGGEQRNITKKGMDSRNHIIFYI